MAVDYVCVLTVCSVRSPGYWLGNFASRVPRAGHDTHTLHLLQVRPRDSGKEQIPRRHMSARALSMLPRRGMTI